MFKEILSNVNVIDVLMAVVLIRCLVAGVSQGVIAEFFKILGTLTATFVTLHYYAASAKALEKVSPLSYRLNEVVNFIFYWSLVLFVFWLLRKAIQILFSPKILPAIDKLGGAVIAIFRSALVAGLTFMLIFVSGNSYLKEKVQTSYSGIYLQGLSPKVYGVIFDGFIHKVFPAERKNPAVFELIDVDDYKK